jgi:hypothetical protein
MVSRDSDTIYVCTDTGNIYLGNTKLFESNAYIDSSITGKIVTFTTHGANGTTGTDTLDLSTFQTAAEVQDAISASLSAVYRPAGSISANVIPNHNFLITRYLIEEKVGCVYNVDGAFTTTDDFVEGAGNNYPSGTNIVVINAGTSASPSYKFDVLSSFMDFSGYMELVDDATSGNLAGLDANGQVTDSGYNPANFKTKQTPASGGVGDTNGAAGGQYVEQVTQNDNGEITVTRKKLPDFQGSGSVGSASSSQNAWKILAHDVSLSSGRVLSGNTKTIPAATSQHDGYMTSEQAAKLDSIENGGEENAIESVKVSGSALTIDSADKSVNIETGTAYNATTNKIATMSDISDAALAWGSF